MKSVSVKWLKIKKVFLNWNRSKIIQLNSIDSQLIWSELIWTDSPWCSFSESLDLDDDPICHDFDWIGGLLRAGCQRIHGVVFVKSLIWAKLAKNGQNSSLRWLKILDFDLAPSCWVGLVLPLKGEMAYWGDLINLFLSVTWFLVENPSKPFEDLARFFKIFQDIEWHSIDAIKSLDDCWLISDDWAKSAKLNYKLAINVKQKRDEEDGEEES